MLLSAEYANKDDAILGMMACGSLVISFSKLHHLFSEYEGSRSF
jgi:hypothetical protein